MKSRLITTALVLSVAALGACSTSSGGNAMFGASATDRTFGDSVREARLRQTIDMNAGNKHAATVGTDGRSGQAAVKRYYKSFKRPVTQPTIKVLGIGNR